MRAICLLLAAALPLAACAKHDTGTSITINGSDGTTLASANGDSGEVKLDLPGFQGKIAMPKIQVAADDFDLNGVHLYPGSTIQSLNVAAHNKSDSGVRIAFTSPAAPATVRDWLMERLNKADFTVSAQGTGLVGTTDENKPFRLDLMPTSGDKTGGDKASGVITIGT